MKFVTNYFSIFINLIFFFPLYKMKHSFFLIFLWPALFFAQSEFNLSLEGIGIVGSEDDNPFWIYSNQKGRIDKMTDYMGLANIIYKNELGEKDDLELGGGLLMKDGLWDGVSVDELYGQYTYSIFQAVLGIKHKQEKYKGLSSVGGDILWSNNAPAIPGIELKMIAPLKVFKWFYVDANIAHYELNDERVIDGAKIHHKSLNLQLKFDEHNFLSGKLYHYVQWGGVSEEKGPQPTGLSDLIKIFFGSAGADNATDSDQANALGNHLGSYELKYKIDREDIEMQFYFQSLFEDRSGRELSNFPDGVWGAFFDFKNEGLINGLLVEYVQTISQGGRYGNADNGGTFSGGDNYFIGNFYASGWTYKDRIIGLPFIFKKEDQNPFTNSRSYVYHFGISGKLGEIDYTLKNSYVKNLGTYYKPLDPSEKAVYTYADLHYPSNYGDFSLILGADFTNISPNRFAAGIGYSYSIPLH